MPQYRWILKSIMLNERKQSFKTYVNVISFIWSSRIHNTNLIRKKNRTKTFRGAVRAWLTGKGHKETFWIITLFYILKKVCVTWIYEFVKVHWIIHLRLVHFTVYIFYLKKRANTYLILSFCWNQAWSHICKA